MKWLVKFLGLFKIPYKRKVSLDEIKFFKPNYMKSSVIVCHTPWQLSNLFIKGKYKHTENVVSSYTTVGAVTKGTRITEIKKVLEKCDKYAVLKFNHFVDKNKVVDYWLLRAKNHTKYDFDYDDDQDDDYCSDLTRDGFEYALGKKLEYGKIVHPQELVDDKFNFTVVKEFEA